MRVLGFEGMKRSVVVGPLTYDGLYTRRNDGYYVLPYFSEHSE